MSVFSDQLGMTLTDHLTRMQARESIRWRGLHLEKTTDNRRGQIMKFGVWIDGTPHRGPDETLQLDLAYAVLLLKRAILS